MSLVGMLENIHPGGDVGADSGRPHLPAPWAPHGHVCTIYAANRFLY